jgi:prepilin-type N-terminal cleavage/methylation domain-containing protein
MMIITRSGGQSLGAPGRADFGFTLLELMIAVGLMAFIMTLVAAIFSQTSATYVVGSDRLSIYSSARAALDIFANDINGCLPIESGQQNFTLLEDKEGENIAGARDRISFRAVALVKQQPVSAQIEYYLVEDTDPSLLDTSGKSGRSKTTKTQRQLYVLRREARDADGQVLDSVALCHYVLSFNIEVYDRGSRSFKQLSEVNYDYPIGDRTPVTEKLPLGLRISLRVIANAAERQERIILRVVSLPMGE